MRAGQWPGTAVTTLTPAPGGATAVRAAVAVAALAGSTEARRESGGIAPNRPKVATTTTVTGARSIGATEDIVTKMTSIAGPETTAMAISRGRGPQMSLASLVGAAIGRERTIARVAEIETDVAIETTTGTSRATALTASAIVTAITTSHGAEGETRTTTGTAGTARSVGVNGSARERAAMAAAAGDLPQTADHPQSKSPLIRPAGRVPWTAAARARATPTSAETATSKAPTAATARRARPRTPTRSSARRATSNACRRRHSAWRRRRPAPREVARMAAAMTAVERAAGRAGAATREMASTTRIACAGSRPSARPDAGARSRVALPADAVPRVNETDWLPESICRDRRLEVFTRRGTMCGVFVTSGCPIAFLAGGVFGFLDVESAPDPSRGTPPGCEIPGGRAINRRTTWGMKERKKGWLTI